MLRCVVAQGLEVSRGEVLQHKIIQAQVRYQTLQLRVLLLQLLQPLRLVDRKRVAFPSGFDVGYGLMMRLWNVWKV